MAPPSFWDAIPETQDSSLVPDTPTDLSDSDSDGTESELEEIPVVIQMVREESDLPPTQMLDAHDVDSDEEKSEVPESQARFLRRVWKLESKRKEKIRRKRVHYERKDTLETAITDWFRRRMMELRIWNNDISDTMNVEFFRLRSDVLRQYGYGPVLSNARMDLECAACQITSAS